MKTTKIEKAIVAVLSIIILLFSFGIYHTVSAISDAGGIGAIIVGAGKEIKDISREIEEH